MLLLEINLKLYTIEVKEQFINMILPKHKFLLSSKFVIHLDYKNSFSKKHFLFLKKKKEIFKHLMQKKNSIYEFYGVFSSYIFEKISFGIYHKNNVSRVFHLYALEYAF